MSENMSDALTKALVNLSEPAAWDGIEKHTLAPTAQQADVPQVAQDVDQARRQFVEECLAAVRTEFRNSPLTYRSVLLVLDLHKRQFINRTQVIAKVSELLITQPTCVEHFKEFHPEAYTPPRGTSDQRTPEKAQAFLVTLNSAYKSKPQIVQCFHDMLRSKEKTSLSHMVIYGAALLCDKPDLLQLYGHFLPDTVPERVMIRCGFRDDLQPKDDQMARSMVYRFGELVKYLHIDKPHIWESYSRIVSARNRNQLSAIGTTLEMEVVLGAQPVLLTAFFSHLHWLSPENARKLSAG